MLQPTWIRCEFPHVVTRVTLRRQCFKSETLSTFFVLNQYMLPLERELYFIIHQHQFLSALCVTVSGLECGTD